MTRERERERERSEDGEVVFEPWEIKFLNPRAQIMETNIYLLTLICVGIEHKHLQECDLVVIFRCLPFPQDKQLASG